jgi:cysteinyl-tRNA synthetase
MPRIKIYNTMSGTKEDFVPITPNKAGLYCCGPTTYNYIHLGNARPLVVFDTVRRYLEHKGYEVTFVQNFTDVDDKIIQRANAEGIAPHILSKRYMDEYFIDADALNVKRATFHPLVSEHMDDIIRFIQVLVNKNRAYEVEGDVYYSIAGDPDYGKLSKRNRDDLLAGARVDIDERKKDAADFALWKSAKPGEPFWESPWGKGRPGWHIECSAMAAKYLGESFDIHGGGHDLIFPHHENEIAQSEACFEKPMARYWMHNGFITINQEKMSKSLGNFFLVREITDKFPPQVIRFYLLSTHYRSQLDFDDEKLTVASKGLDRLKTAARLAKETLSRSTARPAASAAPCPSPDPAAETLETAAQTAQSQFEAAMDDDFNTALAIAALFDLARELNGASADTDRSKAALSFGLFTLLALVDVLGLDIEESARADARDHLADTLMDFIIQLRQGARSNKDYKTADAIRDGLKERGVLLEDTPQGAQWRRL